MFKKKSCFFLLFSNSSLFSSFVASLCNACGLRYNAMMSKEKQIPPNTDPKPFPITNVLNNDNDNSNS